VGIRFDPERPSTVRLSERFEGAGKAMALIVIGGALLIDGFAGFVARA
jgi:hypothetical protein